MRSAARFYASTAGATGVLAAVAGWAFASPVALPFAGGRYAPALTETTLGEKSVPSETVAAMADVDRCGVCHAEAVAQWRSSAHAHSSFSNPWYRAAVESFRREQGRRASRQCAGCHDPLLLLGERMDGPVQPSDPLATAGVTCLVCHSAVATRPDGNGSYTIDPTVGEQRPDPEDPASVEQHRQAMRPPVLSHAALCGTCHRSFLGPEQGVPHHLAGMDDLSAWQTSAYSGNQARRVAPSVPRRTCQGCHMPEEAAPRGDAAADERGLRSHRFAGGQTALAQQTGDAAQLRSVRGRLRSAATVDITAVEQASGEYARPAETAEVQPGDRIVVDVVIKNRETGHRFPGGVRDTQDSWIDFEVLDARGRRIARAGDRARGRRDRTAYVLRTAMIDQKGTFELGHRVQRFRTAAYDHTVAPHDAEMVRYVVSVPHGLRAALLPLRMKVTLKHRRHARAMHDLGCLASRSVRGLAFARAARRRGQPVVNACDAQPITVIAQHEIELGRRSPSASMERAYHHALASLHEVTERSQTAYASLTWARSILNRKAPRSRAEQHRWETQFDALEAQLLVRDGRWPDALAVIEKAESRTGPHPALDRIRGLAHAKGWRWDQAEAVWAATLRRSPQDATMWALLAQARTSKGRWEDAFAATRAGLARAPRDGKLLHQQWLAAQARSIATDPARRAWLAHRRPDRKTEWIERCDRGSRHCWRDRQPVVVIRAR